MTDLHSYGEIILRFRRKENVHSLFREGRVTRGRVADLNDVQLAPLHVPDGEAEQGGVRGVVLHPELREGRRVAFNGLADLAFNRV